MYIKLDKLNLRYHQETNDWFILSEIPDTSMSYEKPILIRTTEELDIWFGKDFPDYDYMNELLNQDVVLYLYKPVLSEIGSHDYVDIDSYILNESIILREIELPWVSQILCNPEEYKFKYFEEEDNEEGSEKIIGFKIVDDKLQITYDVENREFCTSDVVRYELPDQIIEIYNNIDSIGFKVYDSESKWIFLESEIVDTELLPQNINQYSLSLNNRDTLILGTESSLGGIKYSYSEFDSFNEEIHVINDIEVVNLGIDSINELNRTFDIDYYKDNQINMDLITSGYLSLCFSLSGTLNDGDYIILPYVNTLDKKQVLFYMGEEIPKIDQKYFDYVENVSSLSEIESMLVDNLGYKKIDSYFISPIPVPITYFFYSRYKSLILTPNIEITCKILESQIKQRSIEFWSKTIGRGSKFDEENELIKVNIEKLSKREYRITVSRFDYTEIFEGPSIIENPGEEERIDYIISRESKLIRCNIKNPDLMIGTFILRGAKIENNSPEMFRFSLKKIFSESDEPVYPDYFLVYDKYKYVLDSEKNPDTYLKVYDEFLEYSREFECQFLIENLIPYTIKQVSVFPDYPKENVYYLIDNRYYDWNGNEITDTWFLRQVERGGDFVFNYTGDKENRLLYFYRGFSLFNLRRPAYYIYLFGLLSDTYSLSTKQLLYNTPTENPYEHGGFETILEEYKSNYLVCNNLVYYYKKYQNGKDYITTGWMRFAAGKISRELQKHKWDYLGQQLLGKVRTTITELLWRISETYSIIRSINLVGFEPDLPNNSLSLEIDTYVNDLVNNHIKLDITVDYNNINKKD